jgi:nucleoside-diphosphate-sugar epimerase
MSLWFTTKTPRNNVSVVNSVNPVRTPGHRNILIVILSEAKNLSSMKIGVLGGTGNISKSFVKLLLQQGHDVVCINRGQTPDLPKGARHLQADRTQQDAFEKIVQKEKFDAGYDMICFTKDEALSTIRAFRGVKHFIHCSTVCTYGGKYDFFPATEDHPLRPLTSYGRNKVEADNAFLEAYRKEKFPVTIIKPSTTYGPKVGIPRQIKWEQGFIDRILKGKPIVITSDGKPLHQYLHVDDAALCFAGVLGKKHCIGEIYNMVDRGFTTWYEYHQAVMRVLGREVEMVSVSMADLETFLSEKDFDLCKNIFAYSTYYSAEKLFKDVPEFRPKMTLEDGLRQTIEVLKAENRIPDSDKETWEDEIIAAQRRVRAKK